MAQLNRTSLESLIDQIDMIEKRIKGERLRYGGLKRPILMLLAVGHVGPLLERRASRRRVRKLERERDRLLGLIGRPDSSESR